MKKILSLYLIVCTVLFIVSCSDNDDYQTIVPKFTITKSDNIDLSAKGGVATVEFISEGTEVNVTVNADWCKIKDLTNNKVTLTVDVNADILSRSALVVLTDGETTQQVSILQTGAVWIYDRDQTTIYVKDTPGDVFVEMSATFPVEVPEEISDWATCESTNNGFKLTIQENTTGERRSSSFAVKMGGREVQYTVVQYAVKDLLGAWGGKMQMVAPDVGVDNAIVKLEGTVISEGETDGQYLIHIPLDVLADGLGLDLVATYQGGKFIVTTPQQQDIILSRVYYGSAIAKTLDGRIGLNADIALVPSIEKGVVTLSYESNIYFIVGFFVTPVPAGNSFTGMSIDFPAISMQKSIATQ